MIREHSLERWLFLRLAMATLVLMAGVVLLALAADNVPRGALYGCLLAEYLAVGVGYTATRGGVPAHRVQAAELVWDLVVITACVHLTGGVGSRFALLYFFPILLAGFALRRRGALVLSMLAAGLFVVYALAVTAGVVRPEPITFRVGTIGSDTLVQGYFVAALLLIVGYMAGELSGRIERKARLLAQQRDELVGVRAEVQSILSNMSSGILTLDAEGRVEKVNPAAERILGAAAEQLVGRELEAVLGGGMPILVDHFLDALAQKSTIERVELNVEREDGSVVPLGLSISHQRDADGSCRGVIGVFQDLSSVVRMRDRIRANDRLAAMGELSASIAHEIRNPLASIRGSVEMLAGELELSGENAGLMELVLKESERLNRIIEDFLEFARLKPLQPRNCRLAEILDELLQLVRNRSDLGPDLDIEVSKLPCDAVVNIDEELMMQVFQNLAINALESMAERGTLTIAVSLVPDESPPVVIVRFIDEGHGIDDECLPRLFEPFFTTKPNGTGLGLPLANRIVTNHDGRIEARNVDGGGAEFAVHLPLVGIWDGQRLQRGREAMGRAVEQAAQTAEQPLA
jgi:two-component system sensor histidine kinase PilS (NtrC family)